MLYSAVLAMTPAAFSQDEVARQLFSEFDRERHSSPAHAWSYDYREYFGSIPAQEEVEQRRLVVEKYMRALDSLQPMALTEPVRTDYRHLRFLVEHELRRLDLEQRYIALGRPATGDKGIAGMPDARQWYELFVERFTTMRIPPDDLYAFGLREIAQAQFELQSIRNQLGFRDDSTAFHTTLHSERFILTDMNDILRGYESIQAAVYRNLPALFASDSVPPPVIAAIPSAGPQSPPAYYDPFQEAGGTFYFNFYGNRHNSRSMPFLYLHEAVPGHHYQFSNDRAIAGRPAFAADAMYPGYFEGWAAYTELLGDTLGVYTDLYDRFGRWEWDLVRSVRICIDVGIHAKGWTKEQAREFWHSNIAHLDDIAEREVQRCLVWPGQVLSYKVGETALEALRDRMQQQEGRTFDIRQFHAFVLERGQLPLPVLSARMSEYLHSRAQHEQ